MNAFLICIRTRSLNQIHIYIYMRYETPYLTIVFVLTIMENMVPSVNVYQRGGGIMKSKT